MTRLVCILALLAALFTCCTGSGDNKASVPRRTAYPRLEPYDTATVRHILASIEFDVNTSALLSTPRKDWLDIEYPRYGATLHLSARTKLTKNELQYAAANRMERMLLNLGGTAAQQDEFESGCFNCLLLRASAPVATPVQFLAVDPDGRMLSGTAAFHGNISPADSIRPYTEALGDEAMRLLQSLNQGDDNN